MTGSFDTLFSKYSQHQARQLQSLRELIHETALAIPQIDRVEECLKWGQPSFVAKPDKIGSTVRIDAREDGVSIYFTCSTNLVDGFREIYPDTFNFVGNREIHFRSEDQFPRQELGHCIAMALTHHLRKKK